MTQTLLLLVALVFAVMILGWLVATWWFADNQPALGPQLPGRVTFKAVVQGALRDAADLVRPVIAKAASFTRVGWHNAAAVSVGLLDVYAGAAPELRDLIAHDPRAWAVLALLNLVARFGLPGASATAHA